MKATAFDMRISKEAAMELIKPAYYQSGKSCLKEELAIEIMCKEYGQDDDWVGIESDDYETLKEDKNYKTFEIWF